MKHISIKVSGKVQGVFYRASAKERADELGVVGFVRNERDGSVYMEAEGNNEQLALFKAWCNNGPRLARVDVVEIKEASLVGFSGFEVRR